MSTRSRMIFNNKNLPIRSTALLNIDSAMVIVESILCKYLTYGDENTPVWYVRGYRYPLKSRSEAHAYTGHGMLQHKPWHPYLVLPMLLDMIEYYQYKHTDTAELFISNPLSSTMYGYNIASDVTDSDIIINYIPNVCEDDLYEIANTFLSVYTNELKNIFIKAPNAIYSVCVETNMYRLHQHEDIGAYRYREALTNGGCCGHNKQCDT